MLRALLCLLVAAPAFAASVSLDWSYREIPLTTGEVLRDVTIKRYDNVSERVLVQVGRSARTLQRGEFPAEIVARLDKRLAPLSEEDKTVARREVAEEERARRREAAKAAAEREQADREDARQIARESRRQTTRQAERAETREETLLAEITATARAYIRRRIEYRESSSSIVFTGEYELRDPVPVAGWDGRYRIEGRAYTREYASQGGFSTRQRDFELLIQTKPKGSPEVVDFTVK
jgi:flagellar biosynthesis GTPase FlhF